MRLVSNDLKLRGPVWVFGLLLLPMLGALACGEREGGPSLTAPESPQRIISLVPALTEITYALGEEERLVGVSFYCKFPAEALEKPRVGALINADYEHVLSLNPDCMILRPEQEEVARRLEGYGIRSIRLELNSIDDIRAAVIRLGELYERNERAERLLAEIEADLEEARESARAAFSDRSDPEAPPWRPRVLFVVGRNPGTLQQIYAAGTGSFVEELIEAAGGRNVLENTSLPWPVVGKEAILALDPDVIVDGSYLSESLPEEREQVLMPWQQLSVLRAVREGRIVALHDDHMLIPGPSVGVAARRLGEALRKAFPERTWSGSRSEPPAQGTEPPEDSPA